MQYLCHFIYIALLILANAGMFEPIHLPAHHTPERTCMLEESMLTQLKTTLEPAQTVLVILGEQASVDEVAAGLGLHLTLRNAGKDSRIVAVQLPKINSSPLSGQDQLSTDIGNENLTISFDYSEDQVDKVSYHIGEESQKFYLTIKPKAGHQPLDTSTVEFNYTGASADVIVLVGVSDLESLQQLYYGYEDLFTSIPIISLGQHVLQSASVQLPTDEHTPSSQLTAEVAQQLAYPIPKEAANNFLYGIEYATKGLSSSQAATPELFEIVGALLRIGAQRLYVREKSDANSASVNNMPILSQPTLPRNNKRKKLHTSSQQIK